MPLCAIYTRISLDDDGEQDSTPRQERACRAHAASRGWGVREVFEDVDLSAFKPGVRRPGYEAMLRSIAAQEIDLLLVWRLDRLVRRPVEFERVWSMCEATNTQIVSVTEPIDTGDSVGLAVVRILVTFAGLESTVRGQRLRAKHRDDALMGIPDARRRWGYTLRHEAIIPEEAAVVREAAERVLAGESLSAICHDWVARGVRTPRDTAWLPEALRGNLQRPYLAGHRTYRGEIVAKNCWPRILDDRELDMIRVTLRSAVNPTRRASPMLLTGFVRCGLCGVAMYSIGGRVEPQGYKCKSVHGCTRMWVTADNIDRWVTDQTRWRLRALDLPHPKPTSARTDGDVVRLLDKHAAAVKRLHVDYYLRGVMSHAEYMLARENLFGVSREKVARIAPSWRPPGVPVDLNLTGLADGWYDFSIHVRRSIMSMVLSHIVVHTPRQRSGYFNPERLEPHWLHGDPVSEPPPFELRRRADHFWDHPAGHRPTPRPEIDPTLLEGCGRTLDPAEASVLTGLTCHQLGLARRKGDLHATKVGRAFRYDEEELNRYLTWRAVQREKWLTQRRSQRHTARHQGQYWSGREVREYLDIGPTTLRRLVNEGLLTEARLTSRLYAYQRNEVVSLVEQSRVQPSRRATTARLQRNNAPLP